MITIQIVVKGYNISYIQAACLQIQNLSNLLGFSVGSLITLPRTIKKYIVLRSPHVNKKAREQFEVRNLKRVFYIKTPDFTPSVDSTSRALLDQALILKAQRQLNLFSQYLSLYPPFGVNITIVTTKRFNCVLDS